MAQTFVRKTAEISIGEKKIVLTPLTLAELQEVQERAKSLKDPEASWIAYVNGTAPLIQASMARALSNGDKPEDPRLVLDLESWQMVWNKLLEISGLRVAAPGEEKPATEAA